jgi:hypothetical protein
MTFVRASRRLLGWGSVAFGMWGLVHPRSLTSLMGDDPKVGRWLGFRDTVVGAALLGTSAPWPVGLRLAADVHDAIRLRKRSPGVALGAAGFAAWGAATLAAGVAPDASLWAARDH